MQYRHLKLLKQMLDKGVDQKKVFRYFQLEGYSEKEIIEEINAYEREKALERKPVPPPPP